MFVAFVRAATGGRYDAMPEQPDLAVRLDLFARDEAATIEIAQAVASLAARGDVIGLIGKLGSGKTVFARGFIRSLTRSSEEVPSPTFTLVQVYPTDRGEIWHFDLLSAGVARGGLGARYRRGLCRRITLMEWPRRLGHIWPSDCLEVTLATVPGGPNSGRTIGLAGGSSWRDRWGDLSSALAAHGHD